MTRIDARGLRTFSARLLEAAGFACDAARQMADLLVWANLRGIDSHGVLRIPRYIEMLEEGSVHASGEISNIVDFGAVSVLDCGLAPGAVGMNAAVARASERARSFGVGVCAARAISHSGAIGYFANALAAQGQVGIVMGASGPQMAYHGARGKTLSTNPLAIAAPLASGPPFLLDMSTSAVALGKVMAARDAGRAIPEGWALDAAGAPVTDPGNVDALLPMAGAKGSGLSLMIEVLTSVLAGNPIIAPVLARERQPGFNGLAIALSPAAFGDARAFASAAEDLAKTIHDLEPTEPGNDILLPGERGARIATERGAKGVPLPAGTIRRLGAAAERLNVPTPPGFAAGDLKSCGTSASDAGNSTKSS